MSLSFGPEALRLAPAGPGDVTVTRRDGGTVTFASPIAVDSVGRVSFTVTESGAYTVAVARQGTTYERNVVLEPDTLDLSDIGRIRTLLESLAAGGVGGGNGLGVAVCDEDDYPRPAGIVVLWIDLREDRSVAPANMGPLDIRIDELEVEDTQDPAAPSFVGYSSLTDTSVTISWTAGSDNIALAGYNYRVDGGSVIQLQGLTTAVDLDNLTPETEYTVDVQARDTAGNVSTWTSTTFTTEAAPEGGVTYSVYGADTPPGTWVWADGATPYIVTARGFASPATDAQVVGGRAWIPFDASGDLPTQVTFTLHGPDAGLDSAPVQTKVVSLSGVVAGTWASGMFDAPTDIAPGETMMIGVRFTGGADAGKYAFGTETRVNSNAVPSNGPLGEDLTWVAQAGGTVNLSSSYKIGTAGAAVPAEQTQSYGVDVLVTATV